MQDYNCKKKRMQKQKFFVHQISIRLMDHEFKKITQICQRRKKNRSLLVREILQSGIETMFIKKPVTDESRNNT